MIHGAGSSVPAGLKETSLCLDTACWCWGKDLGPHPATRARPRHVLHLLAFKKGLQGWWRAPTQNLSTGHPLVA